MTKFYRDIARNYIGGFDGEEAPEGAIEVPNPPEHGFQKWSIPLDDWDPDTIPDLKESALDLESIERLLRGLGSTQNQIDQAKRDKGKPF